MLLGLGLSGFVLAGAGIVRLVRAALALKGRLDAYADLPLRMDIALARRRVAFAERRIATVPGLVRRTNGAVERIDAARRRVVAMGGIVVRVVRRPRGTA